MQKLQYRCVLQLHSSSSCNNCCCPIPFLNKVHLQSQSNNLQLAQACLDTYFAEAVRCAMTYPLDWLRAKRMCACCAPHWQDIVITFIQTHINLPLTLCVTGTMACQPKHSRRISLPAEPTLLRGSLWHSSAAAAKGSSWSTACRKLSSTS